MSLEKTIYIDVSKVIGTIKDSMMNQSQTIACHRCDKAYCCRNQVSIQISDIEFELVSVLITEEQKERARKEIAANKQMFGKTVYTCPFNNPDTGMCEIYNYRFVVCAGHGVIHENPEVCNTEGELGKDGTKIVNPMNTMEIAVDTSEEAKQYLMHLASGNPTDILEEFKKII